MMWGTVEGWPQPQNLLGGPANLAAPDSWGGKHCEEPLETVNTLSLEMRQGRRWLDYGQLLPGSSLTTGPLRSFLPNSRRVLSCYYPCFQRPTPTPIAWNMSLASCESQQEGKLCLAFEQYAVTYHSPLCDMGLRK